MVVLYASLYKDKIPLMIDIPPHDFKKLSRSYYWVYLVKKQNLKKWPAT
jgi:hypothetical protein